MEKNARIPPMIISVVEALRASGLRNVWTPLLIASIPVSAAHPAENARMTRNSVRSWVAGGIAAIGGSTGGRRRKARTIPVTISETIEKMKRYVGTAKI